MTVDSFPTRARLLDFVAPFLPRIEIPSFSRLLAAHEDAVSSEARRAADHAWSLLSRRPAAASPAEPVVDWKARQGLVSTKEAAKLLGYGEQTLRALRVKGGGPRYVRRGRNRVSYDVAELARWTADRTFEHTAQEHVRREAERRGKK